MNDFKKEDEIYCPECGKLIKSDFTFCPYCRKDFSNKKPDGWDKVEKVGKKIEHLGQTLTILISLPILLIIIFVMCSRR